MKISALALFNIALTCLIGGAFMFNAKVCRAQGPVFNKKNDVSIVSKPISADLFGIFFEDLSYAADGGLYAELIQNRSFEYNPSDRKGWDAFTAWDYVTEGYGYGKIEIETTHPIHINNQHYIVLNIEDEGQEGIGLKNAGFDGIPVKKGENYHFSLFSRLITAEPISLNIQLQDKSGNINGETSITINAAEWKKYSAILTPAQTNDSAYLVVRAMNKGKLAMDVISLFPQKTFKNRVNGLRADLAQMIAALEPKFMRFPGGCLVHGDGVGNIYHWKNTIGPIEQRLEQRNIWNYHQSVGLGYFEYFQFCEDIGAKPIPVVAAAVSCQNSGGTWRIGGVGQRGIPLDEMGNYIQDVLDLIEYANGPATSTWGAKRAAAGHPEPFNLEYLGVGNEDKITPLFKERFKMIYDAVKAKYPDITLIGTVGPGSAGEDYEQGWQLANQLNIPLVDEHYYEKPAWFLDNNKRYDDYDRSKSKVYIGEYASKGNSLFNALVEAAYMTALERNGDVVRMASYAPLIAKENHTSWNPNLIYFSNTSIVPTVNYYVQKLFSLNCGDQFFPNVVKFTKEQHSNTDNLTASCVRDSKTGDIILKIVNTGTKEAAAKADLSAFGAVQPIAKVAILSGDLAAENTLLHPDKLLPIEADLAVKESFSYMVPKNSLSVIRVKLKP